MLGNFYVLYFNWLLKILENEFLLQPDLNISKIKLIQFNSNVANYPRNAYVINTTEIRLREWTIRHTPESLWLVVRYDVIWYRSEISLRSHVPIWERKCNNEKNVAKQIDTMYCRNSTPLRTKKDSCLSQPEFFVVK